MCFLSPSHFFFSFGHPLSSPFHLKIECDLTLIAEFLFGVQPCVTQWLQDTNISFNIKCDSYLLLISFLFFSFGYLLSSPFYLKIECDWLSLQNFCLVHASHFDYNADINNPERYVAFIFRLISCLNNPKTRNLLTLCSTVWSLPMLCASYPLDV